MERSANLLIEHYRTVLIRAAYDNYTRIRFRADDVDDSRLYFGRVPSQFKRWGETGGALITWRNDNREGAHDAILFVECPKSIRMLHRATASTRNVGVVYVPPTWTPHEDQIKKRHPDGSRKRARQLEGLALVRYFVEHLPELTRRRLLRLRARQESSQSSSSLELPATEARSDGSPG